MLIQLIEGVYRLLWGDLLTLHLGNVTLSLSFMVILLLTAGVFFTLRTRLLPVRLFRDMLAAVCEKNDKGSGLSSFQTLVVSTATRVGMGNLVGVVAAVLFFKKRFDFFFYVSAIGKSFDFAHYSAHELAHVLHAALNIQVSSDACDHFTQFLRGKLLRQILFKNIDFCLVRFGQICSSGFFKISEGIFSHLYLFG